MAVGGEAVARDDGGRVVFVPGALPGELVDVQLVSAKRDFARSLLTEVIEPSPHRVEPPCPHRAAGCGGCDWQYVHPAAQLEMKADVVREALRPTAKLPDAPVVVGGAVGPWAYRTSMRFAVENARDVMKRKRPHWQRNLLTWALIGSLTRRQVPRNERRVQSEQYVSKKHFRRSPTNNAGHSCCFTSKAWDITTLQNVSGFH